MLSVLAMASIASTAVLGNTQTVYAGGPDCTVDPDTFDFGLISDALILVPKTIDCFGVVTNVVIDTSDCDAKQVSVSFRNIAINAGVWTGDETAIPAGAPIGIEVQCDVKFEVTHNNGVDILIQEIRITPERDPTFCIVFPNDPQCKVGGEFLPIDSTALMLAGLQSSAIWMLPVLAGAVGVGAFYIKTRMNKDN